MTTTLNTTPLYVQVRKLLSERIATARWRSREALPNEYDLAIEFAVSIGTIRKAIDLLVDEGQVMRRQGRGTFVVDREAPQFTERIDRLRNADGSRIDWLKTIISHAVAAPDPREAIDLRLEDADDLVIRIERVRRDASGPLKYELAAVPYARFPKGEEQSAFFDGIVTLAHAYNITVGAAVVKISVEDPGETVAAALRAPKGLPLMTLRRVVADVEGIPIESSISWYSLKDQFFLVNH